MSFDVYRLNIKTNSLKVIKSFETQIPAFRYASERVSDLSCGKFVLENFGTKPNPLIGVGDSMRVGFNEKYAYWIKWSFDL